MPLDLVYTGKARADLEAIFDYIAKDSPRAARRWVATLEEHCESLCSFPEIGVERPDLSQGIRILPYRRAVITYRVLPGRIRIV